MSSMALASVAAWGTSVLPPISQDRCQHRVGEKTVEIIKWVYAKLAGWEACGGTEESHAIVWPYLARAVARTFDHVFNRAFNPGASVMDAQIWERSVEEISKTKFRTIPHHGAEAPKIPACPQLKLAIEPV